MTGMTAVDLVRDARRHGFDLIPEGTDLDDSGADFVVARAVDFDGVPWIVKAPRRRDVMIRADAERKAQRLVAGHLPAAVPDWRLFTPETIAYPRLDGSPAAVADLDLGDWRWRFDPKEPPSAFTTSLAEVLAALHGIAVDDARGAGLVVLTPADLRGATAASVDRARDHLDVPDALWRRWHDWIEDDASWPVEHVVVHGDLHPAHLLLDEQQAVTGVLDWSEAHVGDPATDFALIYPSVGRGVLEALVDGYGAAGGRTWPRMVDHVVERWCAYPAVIADFGRLSGDEQPMQLAQALVDEAARGMD